MKLTLSVLLAFLLLVNAQEVIPLDLPALPIEVTYSFNLVDASSNPLTGNYYATITAFNNQTQIAQTYSQTNNSFLQVTLLNDARVVELILDDKSTQGNDYYSKFDLKTKEQTVTLQEVATIAIKLENSSVAKIQITCLRSYYRGVIDLQTDPVGHAYTDIPVGPCHLVATKNEMQGSLDFELKKGELKQVIIPMQTKQEQSPVLIIIAIVVLLLILAAYIYLQKTKPKVTAAPTEMRIIKSRQKKENESLAAIKHTLLDRELQIIEILQKNKGKTKQAILYRELLIPKASLSRTLENLERRGIIKVTQNGKINEIELSKEYN